MSFIDNKEEVVVIELTPHGKRLMRDGKFKPAFYSFEDEGIIYDSLYADLTENQSDVEGRILNESIVTDPLPVTYGIETKFSRKSNVATQNENDRTYLASLYSLGTSELKNQYAPAWEVDVLRGEITGSYAYITGSATGSIWDVPIPQITLATPEVNLNIINGVTDVLLEKLDLGGLIQGLDYEIIDDDNVIIEVSDDYILIELDEINSVFKNENFDVEVFLVERDEAVTGSNEVLTPLYFEPTIVEGDIWVEPKEDVDRELTPEDVEYYFEILMDGDIEEDILCKYTRPEKRKGIYGNRLTECEDQEILDNTIYDTDNDQEEEEC